MRARPPGAALGVLWILAIPSWGAAQNAATLPAPLRKVGIDQRLDSRVPLQASLRDESGRTVELGAYFGARPVVLALVYYECPMLCTLVLNGLVKAMRVLPQDVGRDYDVVAISINPRETPALAGAKKREYVRSYGRAGTDAGWHFLTGEDAAVRSVADAVGFRYAYDPDTGEYAHASGIMVLTPQGRTARYLYGVEYSARDLRLSLVEASAGRIGSPVDQVLLFCFHYDPRTGKYGLAIVRIVRVLGSATVLSLGGFIWIMLRRERRLAAAHGSTGAAPGAQT